MKHMRAEERPKNRIFTMENRHFNHFFEFFPLLSSKRKREEKHGKMERTRKKKKRKMQNDKTSKIQKTFSAKNCEMFEYVQVFGFTRNIRDDFQGSSLLL